MCADHGRPRTAVILPGGPWLACWVPGGEVQGVGVASLERAESDRPRLVDGGRLVRARVSIPAVAGDALDAVFTRPHQDVAVDVNLPLPSPEQRIQATSVWLTDDLAASSLDGATLLFMPAYANASMTAALDRAR
jgi:hypothetical protein